MYTKRDKHILHDRSVITLQLATLVCCVPLQRFVLNLLSYCNASHSIFPVMQYKVKIKNAAFVAKEKI